MKKLLIGSLIALSLSKSALGMDKEEFLSLRMQLWNKALWEFVACAKVSQVRFKFQPKVVGKLRIFSEVSGLTEIPVERLERAYSLAVQKAASDELNLIVEQLKHFQEADSEVAFLSGEVPDYVMFTYSDFIDSYSKTNGKRYLKEAFKSCSSLKEWKAFSNFLRDKECSELIDAFSRDVKKLIKLKLELTMTNVYENPGACHQRELELIVKNLKKFGFGS